MDLNLDDLVKGLSEKVIKPISEDREEKDKKKRKPSIGRFTRYTGKLQIFLENEFLFPDGYDKEIIQFKEFFDDLGDKGYTFEQFFDKIELRNAKGEKEVTVDKIKNTFLRVNTKNTLTLKWIRNIADIMGYDVDLVFTKRSEDVGQELFMNETELDD